MQEWNKHIKKQAGCLVAYRIYNSSSKLVQGCIAFQILLVFNLY